MKNWKRYLALFLSVTMLALCLVGCGEIKKKDKDDEDDKDEGSSWQDDDSKVDQNKPVKIPAVSTDFDVDEPVEITFAHTMNAALQAELEEAIADFNRMYPNITVKHSFYGGWKDINGQINTEITMDTQPNIAYCYPDHVAMYNMARAVVPLDELIASEKKIAGTGEVVGLTSEQRIDIIPSFYGEGRVYGDGWMYTMPMSKSSDVLYYNKTFFDRHGLKAPTTWDELWAVCAQIKAIDPTCYPLGVADEPNWFINLCQQYGAPYLSADNGGQYLFDNADAKALMKTLHTNYRRGYFTTSSLLGGYTSNLFTETTNQKSYMCIGSSGGAKHHMSNMDTPDGSYAFEVGVVALPQYIPGNGQTLSQGPSLCVLRGTKTTDQQILASWLFVKFLCTDVQFQTRFSMASGYMPVIQSALQHSTYSTWLSMGNGFDGLVARCVNVGLKNRSTYFVAPAFNGSSKARDVMGGLLVDCLQCSTDAQMDAAFKEAVADCQ
ncbi:MAG: extracellular solute-binding protein [Clostridia bacterium]|nr:extracellular solute-binding protein [Clostridia bacterium]